MVKPTRLDYCQYLFSTPINYTLTHFADPCERFSHDQINRYLAGARLRPRTVWEHVKSDVVQTVDGYVIFDDTVKCYRLFRPKFSKVKTSFFSQIPQVSNTLCVSVYNDRM